MTSATLRVPPYASHLLVSFLLTTLGWTPAARAIEVIRVTSTDPPDEATNVSPDLDAITVSFSTQMKADSYSIVAAGRGETPEVIGSPKFVDPHTCRIAVRLKPSTRYSIGFNSTTRKGFVSTTGIAAEPYVLTFTTAARRPGADASTGSRAANAQKGEHSSRDRSGTVVYRQYVEETRGAFWVLVPDGWRHDGGIIDAPFQSPRLNFSLSSPDGNAAIRFIPGARYLHMPNNPFMTQGATDAVGNTYLALMEPISYLRRIVVPTLYRSGARETAARELVDAAQALKRFYDTIGVAIPHVRCAELSLCTVEDGKSFLDRLIVYVLFTPVVDGTVWETQMIQVRVLHGQIPTYEPILMTALSSFQLNPEWLVALNRAEQYRSRVRMQYQREILEIHERMYRTRACVNEEISRSIGLELSTQAEYLDPKSGEIRTLSSSYENVWTDGNGTFFQTNDPNLDPNDPRVQREMGLSGEFRKMRRK